MNYNIVEILKDNDRFNIKKGDRFVAKVYKIDPQKYILLERLGDGYKPECTEYVSNLSFVEL